MLGKMDIHMQKTRTWPLSLNMSKPNSKWIKDLNVRPETLKLLEENIEEILQNIGINKVLRRGPPTRSIEVGCFKMWEEFHPSSFYH
jgi:hypothetical protein